jgi:transposase
MFIKYEKKKDKDGNPRTFVRVVEGYRKNGKIYQRSIKSYGFLEEQPDKDLFIKTIKEEIEKMKKEDVVITIKAEENHNSAECNRSYNYGYKYLEAIYDFLDIDTFIDGFQTKLDKKMDYKFSEIFKFLTLQRAMQPDSKRASLQKINQFYNRNYHFTLDDTYRSFDYLYEVFNDLQLHIRKNIAKEVKSDCSKVYYDVTNYYCEIDFNDPIENLRHRGVSKEHRTDPIIGMGLFMDGRGIPLKMQIFNGNVSESTTLIPGMQNIKEEYGVGRIIVVADKALNSNPNIAKIISNNDGYLFSQILRGTKGSRYHKIMFDCEGYTYKYDTKGEVIYKSKIFEEDYKYFDKDHKEVKTRRKVLIYYDAKEAIMMRKKRAEKILKADASLKNNAYTIPKGFMEYLTEEIIDPQTKETLKNAKIKKKLNFTKIENDMKFDGYFCIVTSELDYNEEQIKNAYHNLWEIEETFRITKTDLCFRPIYHFKKEHIIVHFMICFTSLILIRLMQYKIKKKQYRLSVERIIRLLNSMNLQTLPSEITHLDYIGGNRKYALNNQFADKDELEEDKKILDEVFGISVDKAYLRSEEFDRYLKGIRFLDK